MPPSQYPTPFNSAHPGEPAGPGPWGTSPCGFIFHEHELEYPSNIVKTMDDGGATYGASSTNAVRRWVISYTGLDPTQAGVLDAHYASAFGSLLGFSFRVPLSRGDTLYTDVHYESYQYPQHEKYPVQSRIVTLTKRPA